MSKGKKDSSRFDALFSVARHKQQSLEESALDEAQSDDDLQTDELPADTPLAEATQAKDEQPENKLPTEDSDSAKVGDRPLGKNKDPNYQRTTLYLLKPLHRKLKAAALEEDREMSEIMEELIQEWLERRKDI